MASLLDEAVSLTGVGALSSGAGSRQLSIVGDLDEAKADVLRGYYQRVNLPLVMPLELSRAMVGVAP